MSFHVYIFNPFWQVTKVKEEKAAVPSPDVTNGPWECDSTVKSGDHNLSLPANSVSRLCEFCGQYKAELTMYCHSCKKKCCSDCEKRHDRLTKFKVHSTVPISRLIFCPLHSSEAKQVSEIADDYCKTCRRFICNTCHVVENHEGHDIVSYEDKVKSTTEELNQFRNQVSGEVNVALADLNKISDDMNAKKTTFARHTQEIDQTLDKFKKHISKLRTEYETKHRSCLEELDTLREAVNTRKDAINQVEVLLLIKDDAEVVQEGLALLDSCKPDTVRPALSVPTVEVPGELTEISTTLESMMHGLTVKQKKCSLGSPTSSELSTEEESEQSPSLLLATISFPRRQTPAPEPGPCRRSPKRKLEYPNPPQTQPERNAAKRFRESYL